MDWHGALLGLSQSSWLPVRRGESGDWVYRRHDGLAYAKLASTTRAADLAGERDRLAWLHGRDIACPEIVDWRETEDGACLVMTALAGIPAVELPGTDLLKAWPSMARNLEAIHRLPVDQCPFDRSLASMFQRAVDVVSRGTVNPDFLPDADKNRPGAELLARVEREMPARIRQEVADRVVCHGDPCLPNFMVDPDSFECTGMIDFGRLGTADRYADFALMIANAGENWTTAEPSGDAFDGLFASLAIATPDRDRLAFYLRLDPLTWG
jgi:streptomycin 3"-kinase